MTQGAKPCVIFRSQVERLVGRELRFSQHFKRVCDLYLIMNHNTARLDSTASSGNRHKKREHTDGLFVQHGLRRLDQLSQKIVKAAGRKARSYWSAS